MDVEVTVTSASKKEESLAGAPAAIYVITSEDIRRSGLSSLPELLRLVPGMTVQHVNSHTWTVSTRGFNGFPNEKMLVLIDGRAVYDSLYGGVSWDTQALRLEDVDRIEVIRGPGGALWGANAVNGVINVVSKSASQTQGLAMSTSLGLNEGYQGSARFGDKTGNVCYRIYGRSSFWDPFVDSAGQEMFTSWHLSDGGMRTDWSLSANDALTIDAGGYQGHIRDTAMVANYDVSGIVRDSYSVQGGHILGRWIHTFSPNSSTNLLSYCDWTNRTDIEFGGEFRSTCDLEVQHDYNANRRYSFIWGGALRSTSDQTRVTFRNHFGPPDQPLNFFSGFGQYDFQILPD
jgi:iron complex outermembrane recepter protein